MTENKKRELFHDYELICKMKIDSKYKVKLLTIIFSSYEDAWRVVGITTNALSGFKDNKFVGSGSKVQRAHLHNRSETFNIMMQMKFNDYEELWGFYFRRDKTVLALSSENSNINNMNYIEINQDRALFKNGTVGWKHTQKEREFLKELSSNQERI